MLPTPAESAPSLSTFRNRLWRLGEGSPSRLWLVKESDVAGLVEASLREYDQDSEHGHWPALEDVWTYPDAEYAKLIAAAQEQRIDSSAPLRELARSFPHEIRTIYMGKCGVKCSKCAHDAAEEEASHDRWGNMANGTLTSSLGSDPFAPNGARSPIGAGVPMGDGVGGRVFQHGDPIGTPMGFGCGVDADHLDPAYAPRPVTSVEEFQRIIKGDFSSIPPHDLEGCEWNSCTERACKNYKRWSLSARLFNRVLDVAESLRFASSFCAGASAVRKIAQAGIPPMEVLAEVHRELLDDSFPRTRTASDILRDVTEEEILWDTPPSFPRSYPPFPRPIRTFPRATPFGMWDAPGAEDLLPVEDHLDKYYVGIFR